MNLVLTIPDDIAVRLGANVPDLERQALEALVLEKFRTSRLSKADVAQLLGFDGSDQVDGFLKVHAIFEPCTVGDIDRDVATLVRLGF